jgi:hypothetical protein
MAVWLGVCAMPSAVQKNMHVRIRRAISKFDAHGLLVESEKIKGAETASLANDEKKVDETNTRREQDWFLPCSRRVRMAGLPYPRW